MQQSRVILGLIFFLMSVSASAKQSSLFSLYRTNYFTEKTMVYSVSIEQGSCSFASQPKFDVFFVKTGTSRRLSEFSSHNRKEFGARSIRVASDKKSLTFKFKALDRVSKKTGKKLAIAVSLTGKGSSCQVTADVLSSGRPVFENIKNFDVEFVLGKIPLVSGLHPKDIRWMGVENSSKSLCIIGQCP